MAFSIVLQTSCNASLEYLLSVLYNFCLVLDIRRLPDVIRLRILMRSRTPLKGMAMALFFSLKESYLKTWSALEHFILQHLPATPKLSGWTLLNEPSRWFLTLLSFCGLFQQAWQLVFRLKTIDEIKQESRRSLSELPHSDLERTRQFCPDDADFRSQLQHISDRKGAEDTSLVQHEHVDDVFCLPNEELRYRTTAARSKKATSFVLGSSTTLRLYATLHATSPQEEFMHAMFQEQKDRAWEGKSGPGNLPLVRLAVLWKSPAVLAVSQVLGMMRVPPNIMLTGYVGTLPQDASTDSLFHSFLESAASLWLEVVFPYLTYPWKLAWLLDPDDLEANAVSLIVAFLKCPPCLLEIGASLMMQQMCLGSNGRATAPFNGSLEELAKHLLRGDSFFLELLLVFFTGKSTNVEVEDNFGRAASMRQFLRGKTHHASTMAAKHYTAELQDQHRRSVTEIALAASATSDSSSTAVASGDAVIHVPEAKRRNTYTQYVKQTFEEHPYLPNESKSQRYQRLRQHIKDTFHRENNEEREIARDVSSLDRAIVADRKRRKKMEAEAPEAFSQSEPAPSSSWKHALSVLCDTEPEADTGHDIVASVAGETGYAGPFGIADDQYPTSPPKLDEMRAARPGFVDNSDAEWRSKHDVVVRSSQAMAGRGDPCCIKYGQCVCQLSQPKKDSLGHIETLFENITRVKKSWGSKSSCVLLLRLSLSEPAPASSSSIVLPASSSTSPPNDASYLKAYMLTNFSFNPFGFCAWLGKLILRDGSVRNGFDMSMVMESVRVPRQVQAAAKVPKNLSLPAISPMHHTAAELASAGYSCTAVSLIFKGEYKVIDLDTIQVDQMPVFVPSSEDLTTWMKHNQKKQLADDECEQLSSVLAAITAGLRPAKTSKASSSSSKTIKTAAKRKASAKTSVRAKAKSTTRAGSSQSRYTPLRDSGVDRNSAGSDAESNGDDECPGETVDDEDMEVHAEWMRCLDAEDPGVNLSAGLPMNFAELEETELTFMDNDDGKVYDVATGKQLGQISERLSVYRNNEPMVTVNCNLHTKCSTMKPAKALRHGASLRYRAWLHDGLRFPGKDQAAAHKRQLCHFE